MPDNTRISLPGYEWLREMFESEEGQQRIAKTRQLSKIAEELGTNMARLAIAWCLKNPNVSTVITGASRVEQVHDNMNALDVAKLLTEDVMDAIEEVLDNKPEPLEFQ
jgi:aryl-alcohol dehydrogenase-like predicted oxidoreductase